MPFVWAVLLFGGHDVSAGRGGRQTGSGSEVSVRVMSVVWEWPLPASEKLVALKLADCADDQGRNSYPAVATIAAVCGLTRRGVQKVLRRLEERGCIEAQAGQPTRCATVVYRVRLEAIVTAHDAPPAEAEGANDVRGGEPGSREPSSPGGRTTFAGGANVVRGGGERGSPDPSVIRPVPVLEQTPRAREGRRPHPLDEPVVLSPKSLALFDELKAVYPRKDREMAALAAWRALDPSLELGAFIVAHVRVRVNAGWVRQTPLRFIPQLCKFIEERRWQERDAAAAEGALSTEGILVVRLCPTCDGEQEGRVVDGRTVYPPCQRCARAGSDLSSERGGPVT